jgi:hypothetical protein
MHFHRCLITFIALAVTNLAQAATTSAPTTTASVEPCAHVSSVSVSFYATYATSKHAFFSVFLIFDFSVADRFSHRSCSFTLQTLYSDGMHQLNSS